MPQLTAFPYLPEGDDAAGVNALVSLCREVPAAGEPLRDFRRRMRSYRLWERERVSDTFRFFGLEGGDPMVPSELMREVARAKGDRARELLAERLWEVNPILFKTIVERVAERVHPPKELFGAIDSHAYPGKPVSWPQFEAWVRVARGLGLLKTLGIALGLGERAERYLGRVRELDVAEYLEEEEEEAVEPGKEGSAEPVASPERPQPRAAPAPAAPAPPAAADYASPLGRSRAIPVSSFAGQEVFLEQILAETRSRIEAWWKEQAQGAPALSVEEFGIDTESWMGGSEEALYRIAVAAALVFRLGRGRAGVTGAFFSLDEDGVLGDLYYGTAPEVLSERADAKALMLASLVARRCAESPDLAAELEKQPSAAAAFDVLDRSLGRGLFKVELFWIMRQLERLGVLRADDLSDFTAVPRRPVRDSLFRLGFLATPYAHEARDLVPAAAAARRAAGGAGSADEVLAAFALAAGCAYDCPQRRRCEYACRERLE